MSFSEKAHAQLVALLEQASNQTGEVSPDTIASIQALAREAAGGLALKPLEILFWS